MENQAYRCPSIHGLLQINEGSLPGQVNQADALWGQEGQDPPPLSGSSLCLSASSQNCRHPAAQQSHSLSLLSLREENGKSRGPGLISVARRGREILQGPGTLCSACRSRRLTSCCHQSRDSTGGASSRAHLCGTGMEPSLSVPGSLAPLPLPC